MHFGRAAQHAIVLALTCMRRQHRLPSPPQTDTTSQTTTFTTSYKGHPPEWQRSSVGHAACSGDHGSVQTAEQGSHVKLGELSLQTHLDIEIYVFKYVTNVEVRPHVRLVLELRRGLVFGAIVVASALAKVLSGNARHLFVQQGGRWQMWSVRIGEEVAQQALDRARATQVGSSVCQI